MPAKHSETRERYSEAEKESPKLKDEIVTCGLVMPISSIDGCSAEHWIEVKSLIRHTIEQIPKPQFRVNLVSDADEIGVIQKRIVQNIYSSNLIICDVSGKNPNVMFELGMRLAFDKPTVIIKDDKTDYSFDTAIIEHITYPRDLRYGKMILFQETLTEKVKATYKAGTDPEHSVFLKNFGDFQAVKLQETITTPDKVIIEMITELQGTVSRLLHNEVQYNANQSLREYNRSAQVARIIGGIKIFCSTNPGISLINITEHERENLYKYLEKETQACIGFDNLIEFRNMVNTIIENSAVQSLQRIYKS